MDKSNESAEEGATSPKSNGKVLVNGVTKDRQGVMQSFRKSFRKAKGSKVTGKAEAAENEPGSSPPPSPSLSVGSPVKSPLKTIGSFLSKKPKQEAEVAPTKGTGLKRSKTDANCRPTGAQALDQDPNFSSSRDHFIRGPLTQSLDFAKRKVRSMKGKKKGAITEDALEEGEEEKEQEEEEVKTEVEETYTLPEIPHTLLSVMQISQMIEEEDLEAAHINLLAMRLDFQREQECCGGDAPVDLANKEKDLHLLYRALRKKISTIVRDSDSPSFGKMEKLLPLARIIQEEEKRAEEPGGLPGSWMEAWREAVGEGVKVKMENIKLMQREQSSSWMGAYLDLLGSTIVQSLENVKRTLRWCYPPSFKVFVTYLKSYNHRVPQILKMLEQQATETNELYGLLHWIINTYKSECVMGNPSLQPDMESESTELQLEENFLKQLKEKYCNRSKEDITISLGRIIEIENEECWKSQEKPRRDDKFLDSELRIDICGLVNAAATTSQKIDAQLEQRVLSIYLQELKQFPERFEEAFTRFCGDLKLQPLWTEYHITYINAFTALQQHMDEYQAVCPNEVDGFKTEVTELITRFLESMEDQFKGDVQPYLRRMMTRKWLTNDEDFRQLYDRIERLSEHCALMRPPHAQEFASRLHYHVVREYIGQLMKNNFSCENQRHEAAAQKIHQQWDKLRAVFEDMETTHEWLLSVGDDLGDIIGQRDKKEIKNHIEPLVMKYPDFRKEHLVAVLNFRGLVRGLLRGREYRHILRRFKELKRRHSSDTVCNKGHVLFQDMTVTVNTNRLPNVLYRCFRFMQPNNT